MMKTNVRDRIGPRRCELKTSRTVYHYTVPVRIMHWDSFISMFLLLLSGFQIFNAHSALYWGETSHFDSPLAAIDARRGADCVRGATTIFGREFDTTVFLGAWRNSRAELGARAFPRWFTVPGRDGWRWAATGVSFFAWLFVINDLAYAAYSIRSRHATRDMLPPRRG